MNQAFWNKNAATWAKAVQGRLIESRKVTLPAVVAAIARRQPRQVLDLGCGEGCIAGELLPRGIRYVGLDFSSALLEVARRTHPGATFEVASYAEMIADTGGWRGDERFDLAVFNFALFDEDLRPILRKVRSFLAPGGAIVIQTLHPCFALTPYQDGWQTEDFKAFPLPFDGTMPWFGRTLGSWVAQLADAGLKLVAFDEPLSPATQKPCAMILTAEPV
jgi:SAM-dependent methyltransferase